MIWRPLKPRAWPGMEDSSSRMGSNSLRLVRFPGSLTRCRRILYLRPSLSLSFPCRYTTPPSIIVLGLQAAIAYILRMISQQVQNRSAAPVVDGNSLGRTLYQPLQNGSGEHRENRRYLPISDALDPAQFIELEIGISPFSLSMYCSFGQRMCR
jgi:hypothetical protein